MPGQGEHHSSHPGLADDVSKDFLLRFANTLLKIDYFLESIDNLPLLLQRIMQESESLLDAEASSLMLYDEAADELFFEVALGPKGDQVREIRLPMGQGIAGVCARERRGINVPDVRNDPRWFHMADQVSEFTTRSLAAVPIVRKDRLIGVLEVLNKRDPDGFTLADVATLEALATQAGIAIENARLYEDSLRSQRLATVGEAIASLAHYVKNVLTGVKGCMSLMEVMLREKRYDLLPNSWNLLKRNVNKVSALVMDMLAYSKDVKLRLEEVVLNDLIRAGVDELSGRAREMEVEVRLDLDESLPPIPMDRGAVERCIADLLTNAFEAIVDARMDDPQGPGLVRVSTRPCGKSMVEMEVVDTGCGIPPQVRNKIFNAFFTTKGSSGSGLGLAVTQKYIHEHGGTITVHAMIPRGTSFRVRLPIQHEDATTQ